MLWTIYDTVIDKKITHCGVRVGKCTYLIYDMGARYVIETHNRVMLFGNTFKL